MRETCTCSLSGGRRPAPASVGAPPPTPTKGDRASQILYRAVDSTGQTIDFLLTANPIPRVINVDKNPAYPAAISALKTEAVLPRRIRLRQCEFLNNLVEQDHRVATAPGMVPGHRILHRTAALLPKARISTDTGTQHKQTPEQ